MCMSNRMSRQPSVVIQAMGRFWAYHAARAAAKAGYLRALVTGRHRREEPGVPRTLRRHIRIPPYAFYAMQLLVPPSRPYASLIWDSAFDALASRHAQPVDVFHGFLAYSLRSMKAYRDLGVVLVVDTGACHIRHEQELLVAEYERFNIKGLPMHPRWVARQVAEYEEADFILAPTPFVRDTLVSYGVQPGKIRVLPYGVDLDRFPFAPPRAQQGRLRVLFIGNISVEKGVPYLLEVAKRLDRFVDLTLVGRVLPDMRKLFRPYRHLVTQHVSVTHAQLIDIIHRSDVLCLPSVQDGSGLVVPEAMSCGRPVIVSENVGAKYLVHEGGGIAVRSRSVEALQAGIEDFLADRSRMRTEGEVAHQVVRPYTWDRYGEQLLSIYREAAGVPRDG